VTRVPVFKEGELLSSEEGDEGHSKEGEERLQRTELPVGMVRSLGWECGSAEENRKRKGEGLPRERIWTLSGEPLGA